MQNAMNVDTETVATAAMTSTPPSTTTMRPTAIGVVGMWSSHSQAIENKQTSTATMNIPPPPTVSTTTTTTTRVMGKRLGPSQASQTPTEKKPSC